LAIALTFLETPAFAPASGFPPPVLFAIAAFVVPGGLPRPRFAVAPPTAVSFSAATDFVGVRFVTDAGAFFAFSTVRGLRSRASGSFVNAFVDFCTRKRDTKQK
jgi:hypothetical protein